LYEDDPAESLFQPTVLYLSTGRELRVGGVPIADAEKPLRILDVDKISGVALTERAFVFNPVINPFDIAHAVRIICLARGDHTASPEHRRAVATTGQVAVI